VGIKNYKYIFVESTTTDL